MKTYTRILRVNIADEWTTDPTHAVVRITRDLAKRILKLSATVRKLKVYCIEEFDYTPDMKVASGEYEKPKLKDLKEWAEGSNDASRIHVTDDSVNWVSYIKHTDVELSTDHISMKELRKFLGRGK